MIYTSSVIYRLPIRLYMESVKKTIALKKIQKKVEKNIDIKT